MPSKPPHKTIKEYGRLKLAFLLAFAFVIFVAPFLMPPPPPSEPQRSTPTQAPARSSALPVAEHPQSTYTVCTKNPRFDFSTVWIYAPGRETANATAFPRIGHCVTAKGDPVNADKISIEIFLRDNQRIRREVKIRDPRPIIVLYVDRHSRVRAIALDPQHDHVLPLS